MGIVALILGIILFMIITNKLSKWCKGVAGQLERSYSLKEEKIFIDKSIQENKELREKNKRDLGDRRYLTNEYIVVANPRGNRIARRNIDNLIKQVGDKDELQEEGNQD
jgi:hypothetical protein